MWSRAFSLFTRVACMISVMAVLVFGHIGCGEDSGSGTGTTGELPPEAKQANKNMEDFMKTKGAAKAK